MFIDFVFNWIHLCTILFIAIYIFIKFFLSQLKKDIAIKNGYLDKLIADKEKIIELSKQADFEIEEQNKQYQELQAKIDLWISVNENIAAQNLESDKILYSSLSNKINEQTRAYEKDILLKRVMPIAISEIEKSLTSYFNEKGHQEDYISKALDIIDRK